LTSFAYGQEKKWFLWENFILDIYYDGIKQDRPIFVDLKILSKKEIQWTSIFLDASQCVKKAETVPIVSRWDDGISDVYYDNQSFRLKIKFSFAEEEVLVRGATIPNSTKFKVEGSGFRKDLSSGKNVKIEWKSRQE